MRPDYELIIVVRKRSTGKVLYKDFTQSHSFEMISIIFKKLSKLLATL